MNGPKPRRAKRDMYRTACDVKCPSCGGYYEPSSLRLHQGHTRGLAICGNCYHTEGPDGRLLPAKKEAR